MKWNIYKIYDDYVVAETPEQVVQHLREQCGPDYGFDINDVEIIPHERIGRFERENAPGYDEMTFGEWLAAYVYKGPEIICWNE